MNQTNAITNKNTYTDFIAQLGTANLLETSEPSAVQVREIIARSMELQPLSVEDTAVLARVNDPEMIEEIYTAASQLKEKIYGKRIVLFAPLYVGNMCVNDCAYCAFRSSNKAVHRATLSTDQLQAQVAALEDSGHKRLIMVFGEHARYDAAFMAESVKAAYSVKRGNGEIRRININAAPLDHDNYKIIKEAGIGTYQIFQETYHRPTFARMHPAGTPKSDYLWRLHGPTRAIESGLDDVGIGALFGLYDWRYELLSLVAHADFLQNTVGVGPHTISFPRLRPAAGTEFDTQWMTSDEELKRLVAILRLAVPYTGLICTAREEPQLRREILRLGVSQIDGGSKIELGGYTSSSSGQQIEREQFTLGDTRTLDDVIGELLEDGYMPSFCTACYRLGRTGEHFMEFAIPGFIKRYCSPNAVSTLSEYLADYASEQTRQAGEKLIAKEMENISDEKLAKNLAERVEKIRHDGERDLCY
jgi:2-iminoacetate synthase